MYTSRGKRTRTRTHKARWIVWLVVVIIVLAGLGVGFWIWKKQTNTEHHGDSDQSQVETPPEPAPEPEPQPALVDLQPTLNQWIAAHPGDYGIVVYDPDNGQVIAEHQPNKQYFTASIYKLYVVYLSLLDIQNAVVQPDETFQGGRTRIECIKEAIRTSDSPCAEKLAQEIGYSNINSRLAEYGLTDTSFPGFVTSAADASLILQRLLKEQELNQTNTEILRTELREQIYRDKGLPKLTPTGAYSVKTGFQGNEIWHDTGILTLPSGREYVVAYLSNNAGSATTAADFGKTIYEALVAAE